MLLSVRIARGTRLQIVRVVDFMKSLMKILFDCCLKMKDRSIVEQETHRILILLRASGKRPSWSFAKLVETTRLSEST